ncbi:MAG: Tetratricopeptide 2 repeat protein [Candidatus Solibacter sp.]|nr:Tetratricopeptide 2 repeat protein [Candidatus Solibacter sp.]
MSAHSVFRISAAALLLAATLCAQPAAGGRGGPPISEAMRQAQQLMRDGKLDEALAIYAKENANNQAGTVLDLMGKGGEARKYFQKAIDGAADPAAKANAQRAMAMSYAFEGDCKNTLKYEQMVMAYWVTREQAEPQNAFYQQGEMANEAARVCIDAGDLETAATWYAKGTELGLKEPGNETHPASLWKFRLEHAQARIAARKGNKAEAKKHVDAAKALLDGDPKMAEQQARFFPYLTGYVALYTGEYKKALDDFQKTIAMPGNAADPFYQCLLGMTYEKLGEKEKAMECYRKASSSTAHNPPAAFARPFTRKKLG